MVEPAYSVVVPVHNEAETLRRTIPALLAATREAQAEIVFVCNGCQDDSAEVIRDLAGDQAIVLEIAAANKTAAFAEAEAVVTAFPRFYLDADVVVQRDVFSILADALDDQALELVSPRVAFDVHGVTWAAQRILEVWTALPFSRSQAFHMLLGVSAAGRARWDSWRGFPRVFADDTFVITKIPVTARRIVEHARVHASPPTDFLGWVKTRSRWRRADRQLERLGVVLPLAPHQKGGLLAMIWRKPVSVMLYVAAVFLGRLRASFEAPDVWVASRRRG